MNIIVVDDERLILESMAGMLAGLRPDARVDCFALPDEALESEAARRADVAILDISMPGMSGVELAYRLKKRNPAVNLIFATGYSEYAVEAVSLRASGYLLKPVLAEKLDEELRNLRHPLSPKSGALPVIQTFGNFEVFINGRPVRFRRRKSKEMLAYLVDRRGASVTSREFYAALWGESPFGHRESALVSTNVQCMLSDLEAVGAQRLVGRNKGSAYLRIDRVDCDYFRFLSGDVSAINAFIGEYMTNYSWAEFTLGSLIFKQGNG